MADKTYSLDELAKLTALTPRTVRYYIQIGLLDRPDGETRAATYAKRHLDQLLEIRRCQERGLSLDQIRERNAKGSKPRDEVRPRNSGSVEVWSRVAVGEGVELHIEPGRAGLNSEQLRKFIRQTLLAFENLTKENEE